MYNRLVNFLIEQSFVRGGNDFCLFSRNENDKLLFFLRWVDDLVITGSSSQDIDELKKTLETKFNNDDLGKLEWFSGMPVSEDSGKITFDQETFRKCHRRIKNAGE